MDFTASANIQNKEARASVSKALSESDLMAQLVQAAPVLAKQWATISRRLNKALAVRPCLMAAADRA